MKALVNEGATVHVISLKEEPIRGWHKGNWAMEPVHVDHTVYTANPAEYANNIISISTLLLEYPYWVHCG